MMTVLPAENHLLVYGPGTAWWRRLDIVGVVLEHGHTLYAGHNKNTKKRGLTPYSGTSL